MNIYSNPHPLAPISCPCDLDFVAYLQEHRITGQSVFHFGTGVHHTVGIECARMDPPNEVLAVTTSPPEMREYMDLVTVDAQVARSYKVLFTDVYDLTPQCLPSSFDLITLFHLGVYHTAEGLTRLDDRGLLTLMWQRLHMNGYLFLFRDDYGHALRETLIARMVRLKRLYLHQEYKSLLVYTKYKREKHQ